MRAKRLFSCAVAFAAALLVVPVRAFADYPADAPVKPFNLPDLSGLSDVGLDLQMTWWTLPFPAPSSEARYLTTTIDLTGDIDVAPHWVIVLRMPLDHTDVELRPNDTSDCCGFALGNFTLGVRGLYSSLEGRDWRSVLGFDVLLSLPTASNGGDGITAASSAAFARQTHDPGRYLPDTWTPRLGVHGQFYNSWLMLQVEAGLHLFLFHSGSNDDTDVGVRLAMAAGVRATTQLAVLLEVNSMVYVDQDDEDQGTATSVDVGLRYGGRRFVAGLRVFVPLDDGLRDIDMLGVGADIGARF